jgi:hypothetical protein
MGVGHTRCSLCVIAGAQTSLGHRHARIRGGDTRHVGRSSPVLKAGKKKPCCRKRRGCEPRVTVIAGGRLARLPSEMVDPSPVTLFWNYCTPCTVPYIAVPSQNFEKRPRPLIPHKLTDGGRNNRGRPIRYFSRFSSCTAKPCILDQWSPGCTTKQRKWIDPVLQLSQSCQTFKANRSRMLYMGRLILFCPCRFQSLCSGS